MYLLLSSSVSVIVGRLEMAAMGGCVQRVVQRDSSKDSQSGQYFLFSKVSSVSLCVRPPLSSLCCVCGFFIYYYFSLLLYDQTGNSLLTAAICSVREQKVSKGQRCAHCSLQLTEGRRRRRTFSKWPVYLSSRERL